MQQATIDRNAARQSIATAPVRRAALLLTLCAASVLGMLVPIAVAEEREDESAKAGVARNVTVDAAQSAIDFAAWPLLDLIDAKTNMAAFFRSGVPAELRLAALRRAWTTDPAIREFKGLSENEWDFDDPNSIPGFGDLGPEVDVPTMVAGILGIPTSVAALSRTKPYDPASSSSFADAIQRVVFGTVHN